MTRSTFRRARALTIAAAAACLGACATASPMAMTDMKEGPGGEAGPISLRDQGFFWAGARTREVENGTAIDGQMYVGYQLVAEPKHPYPLFLVHGGGGQSTDWMGTPDGRDGWLDYFLAAGFDVYFVDRPAHGRSPNSRFYGELGDPPTTQFISSNFSEESEQYPGTGLPDDPYVIQHTASSEPGPTVSYAMLQEDLADALDRIGRPVIMVTHSAGGPSGWLAIEARPDLVKGVLAIETFADFTGDFGELFTWDPPLDPGEEIALEERPSEGPGLEACMLQPEGDVHTLPKFQGKPIMGVVATNSQMFTPRFHCVIRTLDQVGADAELTRLEDVGVVGNGHFMNEELNNGEIAQLFIDWLSTIE